MIVKTEKNIANLSSTLGDNKKRYVRTFCFKEFLKARMIKLPVIFKNMKNVK